MKILRYTPVAVFFMAVYLVAIHTPMQSDDYTYMFIGTNFKDHLHHYMTWSGRLVADYVSGFLLGHLNYYIYSLLNSASLVLMITCISILPSLLSNKVKFSPLCFTLIALLYWIANPNLGQTTFWIVGAANYLWTSMFISVFFVCYFTYANQENVSTSKLFFIFITGMLAGCSNENTSIVTLFIVIFFSFIFKNKKLSLCSIIGIAVGMAVLLLSPGNYIRGRSSSFDFWRNMSFPDKLWEHFFKRFPDAVSSYWQVYLIMILALAAVALVGIKDKRNVLFSIVFMIGSLMANAAFIGSPTMPARALSGGLFFALLSVSFVIYEASSCDKRSYPIFNIASLGFAFIYFIPSYFYLLYAFNETTYQEKIRESIFEKGRLNNASVVEIPQWYFTRTAKVTDRFDTFHSHTIKKYYGINDFKIVNVSFDYGQLLKAEKVSVKKSLLGDSILESIYLYNDHSTNRDHIVFELNDKNAGAYSDDFILVNHIYGNIQGFIKADTKINIQKIGEHLYVDSVYSGINRKDITMLVVGVHQKSTGKLLSRIEVKVN